MTTPVRQQTRAEGYVAAHAWDWCDGNGACPCGLVVDSDDEWVHHAEQELTHNLWASSADLITSERELALVPERSTIIARPGRSNLVCQRLAFGDLTMSAWSDLRGTIRATATLLPALVLERGPELATTTNTASPQ